MKKKKVNKVKKEMVYWGLVPYCNNRENNIKLSDFGGYRIEYLGIVPKKIIDACEHTSFDRYCHQTIKDDMVLYTTKEERDEQYRQVKYEEFETENRNLEKRLDAIEKKLSEED